MLHDAGSTLWSQVLHETFPQHTFLMNGLVQGVKVGPPQLLTLVWHRLVASTGPDGTPPPPLALSGLPVVPVGSSDWCTVGHLGQEVVSPHDGLLHLRPHPVHEDQPLVSRRAGQQD